MVSIMKNLKKLIKFAFPNLYFSRLVKKIKKKFYKIQNYEQYTKEQYFKQFGVKLNLENPQTFYEKINYLKLFYSEKNPEQLIDKVLVKRFISNMGYEKHEAKLIASFHSFKRFKEYVSRYFSSNNDFVVKLNHTSGDVFFYFSGKWKDKYGEKVTKRFVFACLSKKLKLNYYHLNLEKVYDSIAPQILIEEYLPSIDKNGLDEYKFFCNNGEIKLINVVYGRQKMEKVKEAFTKPDFSVLPVYQDQGILKQKEIYRPDCFDAMVDFCKNTSKGHLLIRVDLMTDGKDFKFCEFTYYDCAGYNIFFPLDQNIAVGDLIDISEVVHERV